MLAVQLNATLCGVVTTPVPDKEMLLGEPLALLVTVTVPLFVPADVGE